MIELLSRIQAVQEILHRFPPLEAKRLMPLDGVGLVTATDITAGCNVPEHACSVRDGYALKSSDITKARSMRPVRLEVKQTIRAESRDPEPIISGEAARVLTGGPVPPGADAVLAEEDVEIKDDAIMVTTPVREGWFVRAAGGEIAEGTIITPHEQVITPQAAAVMTRTRLDEVPVHPRPTVRILALGSELSEPGRDELNKFPADNLILMRGLLEQSGAIISEWGVLEDDKGLLIETLKSPFLPDVVITSGGTGRSERDFSRTGALEAGFDVICNHVDMRPGRNMFIAMRDKTLLFGLPGPPTAVFTCFHAVILPVIRRLRGLPAKPAPLKARFTQSIHTKPGSEWLVQCVLHMDGSQLRATPLAGKEVPPMLGMAQAHGLAILQGGNLVEEGDEVDILTAAY